MSTEDLIRTYYKSLNNKDDKWQELYSEDAFFSDAAKILNAKGKEAVIKSFISFIKGIEKVKIKKLIVDGDDACAIVSYDYVNPNGKKMNQDVAEVWEIKKSKLNKLTIYFDLTAYRNFMKS